MVVVVGNVVVKVRRAAVGAWPVAGVGREQAWRARVGDGRCWVQVVELLVIVWVMGVVRVVVVVGRHEKVLLVLVS